MICRQAISKALENGQALLKFISPNDAGLTGSHQCGFYLPKKCYEMFTPQFPEEGVNHRHPVRVTWQGDLVTDSVVAWYGRGTRSEYRLTKFGRDFPFLREDAVGNLLVLVPRDQSNFFAYVLTSDEDMEELQAVLSVELIGSWGCYSGLSLPLEVEDECINEKFFKLVSDISDFPDGQTLSEHTWCVLSECINGFFRMQSDDQLLRVFREEYRLFRLVEAKLCGSDIRQRFSNIGDFLKVASSIMNRRKSRAGRSFENHVERIFRNASIPCEMRSSQVDGKPDIVVPGGNEYNDKSWPDEKLFVIGLKTTCKDRWRQVLNEGSRVPLKHLITLQEGISSNQLTEMAESRISLIVPEEIQKNYPAGGPMDILSLSSFLENIKTALNP